MALEMTEPTKPRLVDSHCHIDMPQFDADREAVLERARAAGVETMLVVGGVDEEVGHRRAMTVAEKFGLPVSAGVHPHEARWATPATGPQEVLAGWGADSQSVYVYPREADPPVRIDTIDLRTRRGQPLQGDGPRDTPALGGIEKVVVTARREGLRVPVRPVFLHPQCHRRTSLTAVAP